MKEKIVLISVSTLHKQLAATIILSVYQKGNDFAAPHFTIDTPPFVL